MVEPDADVRWSQQWDEAVRNAAVTTWLMLEMLDEVEILVWLDEPDAAMKTLRAIPWRTIEHWQRMAQAISERECDLAIAGCRSALARFIWENTLIFDGVDDANV